MEEEGDYTLSENWKRANGFKPLIMKSIHFPSTKVRDQLLKIIMFCGEFEVTQLVIDIEDMN